MDALILPVIALSIPIIVAPVSIGCNLARRMRELEHAERMRALELGLTLPKDEPWWSPSRITATIGVVVPITAMLIAWFAGESLGNRAEVIQVACVVIGGSSVLSGGLLANKYMGFRRPIQNGYPVQMTSNKPAFDPDAYDVVGRRG